MKTVIILSVLIAANVVYGLSEDAQRFNQNYQACAQKLGAMNNVPQSEIVICAGKLDGEFLFSNGAYSEETTLKKLREFISDPVRLQQAYELYFKCDNEAVQSGAVGIEKTMRWLECGSSIVTLFDTT